MKIIGTVGGNDMLVQASRDELANLLGHYYSSQAASYLRVGAEIRVSDMYRQLRKLADAQRELKAASQTLHSVANLVLIADPLIQAVVEPETREPKKD
jgi:hypothetical protein